MTSALAALILAAAGGSGEGVWQLYRNLTEAGPIELAVDEGPLREHVRRVARETSSRSSLEFVLVAPAAARTDAPRVLLGTWETPEVRRLAEALGAEEKPSGYHFGAKGFAGHGDVLAAWFEDPDRAGTLTGLYLAHDETGLISLLEDLTPPARPSARSYRAGTCVFQAELTPAGELVAGTSVSRVPEGGKRSVWSPFGKMSLPAGVDDETADDYGRRVGLAHERLLAWIPVRNNRVVALAYAHVEDKLRDTGDSALFTCATREDTVHVLLSPDVPDDGGAGVLATRLLKTHGSAAEAWVAEAAPVAGAGTWWGRDLDAHIARLAASAHRPGIADLIDPVADLELSPHVRAPLRAALFVWFVERTGGEEPAAVGKRLWTGEEKITPDAELERAFRAHLAELAADEAPPRRRVDTFISGVALEPAGTSELEGYAARGAAESLAAARAVGADAVALSTFTYLDPGWPSLPEPDLARRRRATQSDTALAQIVSDAQSLSMRVLLQPHLLSSPGGHFAGSLTWRSQEGWEAFYDEYEGFLEHYALLAELLGVDLLCIGTELAAATRFEAEPWRRRVNHELLAFKRLRTLRWLDQTRAFFGGDVTLSVRSSVTGITVKDFTLWDRLDVAATAFFPPIPPADWSERRDPVGEIKRRLQASVDPVLQSGRKMLLLPVGFPSAERAHRLPSSPSGSPDPEKQEVLFEALAEVLEVAREREEMAGFFLWKWSTDPQAGGLADSGYTPRGKPAERVLARLFGR